MATTSIVSGIPIPPNVYQQFIDSGAASVQINIVKHDDDIGNIEYEAVAIAKFSNGQPDSSVVICPKPCFGINI